MSILPNGTPVAPIPSSDMDVFIEEETSKLGSKKGKKGDKKPKDDSMIQLHDDDTGMPTVQEAKIQAMQMQAQMDEAIAVAD